MELREDWQCILLNGLPAYERKQTLCSIALATEKQRQHIATVNERERRRDENRQAISLEAAPNVHDGDEDLFDV